MCIRDRNTSAKARKKTTKPTKKKTKVVMASEETSFHQNKKSVRLSNLIIDVYKRQIYIFSKNDAR